MSASPWDRRDFIKTVIVGSTGFSVGCSWDGSSDRTSAPHTGPPRSELRSETFEYCHEVRDGVSLPVPKPSRSVDVVVVAGGLSGLTAAYRLRDRNVLLLEKEPQVGGNARSDSWEGIHYPIGASFTHSGSSPMELYQEIGLAPIRRIAGSSSAIACYNGHRIMDPWGEGFNKVHPEAAASLAQFKKDMYAVDLDTQKAKLDGMVFRDMLHRYDPAVVKWMDIHGEWLGGNSREVSAYAGILFARYFLGDGLGVLLSQKRRDDDHFQFVGGLGPASAALARKIEEAGARRVEVNATAYRVQNTAAGDVLVSYMQGTEPTTVRARTCIVAAPKLIAARIVTDLPAEQKEAMLAFKYIAYTTVVAGFPQMVVPDTSARMLDEPLVGTWSLADVGHQSAHDPKAKTAVRAILPLGGERRSSLLTDEGARAIAYQFADYLERYYPGSRARILEMRVYRRGHNWYTPVPHFVTRLQPRAAQSVGHVAFAHADSVGIISDSDWAVIAGNRAAEQVQHMLSLSSTGKRSRPHETHSGGAV